MNRGSGGRGRLENVNGAKLLQKLPHRAGSVLALLVHHLPHEIAKFGRHVVVVSVSAGSTLSAGAGTQDYFTLGGFLNLSGVTTDSISGPHYGIARVVYYRQIGRGGSGVLELPAYAGVSFEVGNTWNKRSDASVESLRHDASLFFGADTPLGPLYLAAEYDDRHQTAFYLFLGRSF